MKLARAVCHEIAAAMMEGPRLFFAPILGAVQAVQHELGRKPSTATPIR